MRSSLVAAQELVHAIGHAFYPDQYAIVLDALLIEKYIIEDEIAPRLKMSKKSMKEILQQLHDDDGLIRSENITTNDNGQILCYYIDYQSFVNIVRYRIFCMQKQLKDDEKSHRSSMQFKCPTCKSIYDALETQRLITKDRKRACPICCPHADLHEIISEDSFRLIECNRDENLDQAGDLVNKLIFQLGENSSLSLYNLLQELKDIALTRNRPSDNMKFGWSPSPITDIGIQNVIDWDQRLKKKKKEEDERVQAKDKVTGMVMMNKFVGTQKEDKKEVDESLQQVASSRRLHTASVPEFLQTSGVYGAKDTHQELANRLGERETRELDHIDINSSTTSRDMKVSTEEEMQLYQERSAFINQQTQVQTQSQIQVQSTSSAAVISNTVWEDDSDSD